MEFSASSSRGVAHELGEVVARGIHLVERDAQPPDVEVLGAGEDLFAERLGAGVEGAGTGAEGKVRRVILPEPTAARGSAGVDAAGGNVAPGRAGALAGFADAPGQDGVAEERGRFLVLAGVHVGLAGEAGGVDDELGPVVGEEVGEERGVGVVPAPCGRGCGRADRAG